MLQKKTARPKAQKKKKPVAKKISSKKISRKKKKTPRVISEKPVSKRAILKKPCAVKTKKSKKTALRKPQPVLKTRIHKTVKTAAESGIYIGDITHYFSKAKACAISVIQEEMRVGDKIHIRGKETDLKMTVISLQISRIPVESGRPGEEVGLGVKKEVRPGDKVYKI